MYPPGKYEVTITGSAGYQNPTSESTTFILELYDVCNTPETLVPVALANKIYTLGDTEASSYLHADYTVDPYFCPLTYTYTISDLANDGANPSSAISRVNKRFYFEYLSDRAPVGQTQTVTVRATSSSLYENTINAPLSVESSFTLGF